MPRTTSLSVIHFSIAVTAALLLLAPDAPAFDKRTSAFWQNLSAGRPQRLLLSGTSLSNTTYSPWPDSYARRPIRLLHRDFHPRPGAYHPGPRTIPTRPAPAVPCADRAARRSPIR